MSLSPQIEHLQCIRNISIYENRRYLYVVGQDLNHRQEDTTVSYYRILEIQRMNGSLDLNEDTSKVYTKDALIEFLKEQKVNILYDRVYALFGFIRLIESYYLIAITEAEQIANIHGHDIYSVKGSVMISVAYMPRRTVDESRYKGILSNNIDFASGYYFSFTYDLTNSIQNNLTVNWDKSNSKGDKGNTKSNREGNTLDRAAAMERCAHDALFASPYCSQEFYSDAIDSHRSKSTDTDSKPLSGRSPSSSGKKDLSRSFYRPEDNETDSMLGGEPREMYIWNRYALKPLLFLQESHRAYLNSTNGLDCPSRSISMDPQHSPRISGDGRTQSASSIKSALSMDSQESGKGYNFAATVVNPHVMHTWVVPIIHGFISQKYAEFRGSKGNHSSLQSKESHALSALIYTLIARRSSYFAGTRYLRRGTNRNGYVANDVESEQIITTCVEELTSNAGDNNGNGTIEKMPLKKTSLPHPHRPSHVIAHHPTFIYRSSSLVQYRGSIPMYWHHINLMSPHPGIEMETDEEDKLYTSFSSAMLQEAREGGGNDQTDGKGDKDGKNEDDDDEHDNNSTATLESEDDGEVHDHTGEDGQGSGEIRSSRLHTIPPKAPLLYLPARRHFQRLQTTYGDYVSVLNLVKQKHSAREVLVGGEYKAMIRTVFDESNVTQRILTQMKRDIENSDKDLSEVMQLLSLQNSLQVIYRDFDLLHHEHYDDHDAEADIFEEITSIVNEFLPCSGYFVQGPVIDSALSKNGSSNNSRVYSHPLSDSDVTALGVHRSYFDPQIDANADPRQRLSSVASNRDSEDSEAMSSIWRDTNMEDINTWMEGGTLGTGVQNTVCQNGIIRMNCVDCLDRTNIGQFVVAKQAMPMQCRSLGVDLTDSGLDEVLHMATEVWTKHGNELAIQYGGSGAMHALSMASSANTADNNDADTNNSNGKSVVEGVTSVIYKTTSSAVSSTASLLGFSKSSKSEEVSVLKNTSDADGVEETPISTSSNAKLNKHVAPKGRGNGTTATDAANNSTEHSLKPHQHKFQMLGGIRNGLVAVNRYYSNVATDYDKQSAIDLLLGEYVPQRNGLAVWELDNQPQYRRDGYNTTKRKTTAETEKIEKKVPNGEGGKEDKQNDSNLYNLGIKMLGKGVLW